MSESYMLKDLPWDEQLRHVIKVYDEGLITYPEYIIKQNEIIGQALMSGISFDKIQEFQE